MRPICRRNDADVRGMYCVEVVHERDELAFIVGKLSGGIGSSDRVEDGTGDSGGGGV
jgi:hypothetical protein